MKKGAENISPENDVVLYTGHPHCFVIGRDGVHKHCTFTSTSEMHMNSASVYLQFFVVVFVVIVV